MFPLATLILFACALLQQLGYSSTLSSNNNLVYQLFTSTKNVDYLLPSATFFTCAHLPQYFFGTCSLPPATVMLTCSSCLPKYCCFPAPSCYNYFVYLCLPHNNVVLLPRSCHNNVVNLLILPQ